MDKIEILLGAGELAPAHLEAMAMLRFVDHLRARTALAEAAAVELARVGARGKGLTLALLKSARARIAAKPQLRITRRFQIDGCLEGTLAESSCWWLTTVDSRAILGRTISRGANMTAKEKERRTIALMKQKIRAYVKANGDTLQAFELRLFYSGWFKNIGNGIRLNVDVLFKVLHAINEDPVRFFREVFGEPAPSIGSSVPPQSSVPKPMGDLV